MKTPFMDCVKLMVKLHELDMIGMNDSHAADEIRDQMEAPWLALTFEEREVVRKLSAMMNAERD